MRVRCVASLLDYETSMNGGAHPLAMDAHSGNARDGIQMRLTHPPVRAHARSQGRRGMRAGLP